MRQPPPPREDPLRQLHRQNNPQDDRNSDLCGGEAGRAGEVQLAGNEVVGAPEDAGAGDEAEDAANKENGGGTLFDDRKNPGHNADEYSGNQSAHSGRHPGITEQNQIQQPSQYADDASRDILLPRDTE